MRPTREEARALAVAALEDGERTGLPLVDRVAAAIRAGAGMAVDHTDDLVGLVAHLVDQAGKDQYLNAAVTAGEVQALMLRRLNDKLKGRG